MEQLQYLDKDTIQKSKYEKINNELSVKDNIITEKEKIIFEMENTIKAANQRTKEFQQQLETFSLVKKDVENKEKRINTLVLEVERLNQKNITNEEFITRLQEKLEESQERSGNLTGKFELEMANLKALIDDNNIEIKNLRENESKLKNKIYEAEQIEDRLLSEMQTLKDDKLRFESEIKKKDEEIIDLKKRVKLARRESQK
jgi:chromosome segregation ATPase